MFSRGLELPPLRAGYCQKAEWQDEPPPKSRAPGIAPAGREGEYDSGLAAAEMAGWHGLSLAGGRSPTEGYLTRSRNRP